MRGAALRPILAMLAVAAALPARADDPARRGFDPDPPRPALGRDGQFTTDGPRVGLPGSWWMGLELEAVHGLLALRNGGQRIGWVVPDRISAHLLASFTVGRFELGAGLPVALHQRDGLEALRGLGVTGPLVSPVASGGLGDLRLLAKTQLLDEGAAPVSLAASLELRLPIGDRQAFLSDGWNAIPSVLAGRRIGPLRLDASAGYRLRQPGQYLQLVVHDGIALGAAASYDLPPVRTLTDWRAILDLAAELPRGVDGSSSRYRAPASLRGGIRARVWRSLWADLGVGTGLAASGEGGFGRESWRVFGGLRWDHAASRPIDLSLPSALPPDRDGDGVPDDVDRCPDVPGPAELEGCPDRDGDGVPDIDDKCPDEPGPVLNDGCPIPEEEPLVEIETSRLSLRDMIHFDVDRDTIKPESNRILDEIASILKSHAELKKVRIEGHTDNTGSRAYNLGLSQRRAASVVRALVARGVRDALLTAQGYGFDKPVASNATAVGRARNRRVEFTILDGDAAEAPPEGERR
jgi:OOP family OmpA-OmpF porin